MLIFAKFIKYHYDYMFIILYNKKKNALKVKAVASKNIASGEKTIYLDLNNF